MGHCSTIVSDGLTRQLYSNLNQYEWERERALVVGPKYYSKFSFAANKKKTEFKCLLFLCYNKLDLSLCHTHKNSEWICAAVLLKNSNLFPFVLPLLECGLLAVKHLELTDQIMIIIIIIVV